MPGFLTWHMVTVNTNINMHSAVKYWLHRALVRPCLIWAQQFTGEAKNTCCYIEFQVLFLRLSGRQNDKWHHRGVDAKTGRRITEGIFFSFFWLDSQSQKHETRGTFDSRNSALMVYLKASRRHRREKRVNPVSRRRSLAFSALIKHQEGIKEDNIMWGEESCDHGNVTVENIAGQIPIVALLSSFF